MIMARHDRCRRTCTTPGIFSRSSAIAAPGMVLSQATSATMPSNMCPRATNSIESAIRSRLTSDAFMPSVPMVTPSLMAMVLNSMGVPPAARMPALTCVGQLAQVEIARHGLDPRVGDADDGLLQILIGEADGLQHGARGRAVASLGDGVAVKFHGKLLWYRSEGEGDRVFCTTLWQKLGPSRSSTTGSSSGTPGTFPPGTRIQVSWRGDSTK